jgi:hypothetical protein
MAQTNSSANTAVGLVFLVLVVIGVIWFMHLGGSSGSANSASDNSGSSGQTTYDATSETTVVNPADLAVYGTVTNTGTVAGTPTCTIQAHDDSYSYTGTDAVQRTSPLEPGGEWSFKDDVTITNQGAQYVTQVNVSCS